MRGMRAGDVHLPSGDGSSIPVVDRCAECYWARLTDEANAHEKEREAAARQEKEFQLHLRVIAENLIRAGFPPKEVVREGHSLKSSFMGGLQERRDRSRDLKGWYVGTFIWQGQAQHETTRDTRVIARKPMRTYVTADGQVLMARGYNTEPSHDQDASPVSPTFRDEIISAMVQLAHEHGAGSGLEADPAST
jgi:hypothetical protein